MAKTCPLVEMFLPVYRLKAACANIEADERIRFSNNYGL